MTLKFTKMHALGNDFMVVNGITQNFNLSREQIVAYGHRRTGVGFDQLLVVEEATDVNADFLYRIFNADGGEIEQCGNGARCLARFIAEQGLTDKKQFVLQTKNNLMAVELLRLDWVKVAIAVPKILSESMTITVANKPFTLGAIDVGNPHAIIAVDDVDAIDVAQWGGLIEQHEFFPNGANVSFIEYVNDHNIKQRVWERGAGITPACGSAASAAGVMGQIWGKLGQEVDIHFPGGDLAVHWQRLGQPVFLTGPATCVYSAEVAYT